MDITTLMLSVLVVNIAIIGGIHLYSAGKTAGRRDSRLEAQIEVDRAMTKYFEATEHYQNELRHLRQDHGLAAFTDLDEYPL